MIGMRRHVLTILAMSLLLILGLAMPAFAAETGEGANAADTGKGYTYRVTIYAGAQGEFAGGQKVWKNEYRAGESLSISTEDLGFQLKNDKYYVRGFRVTGHDNDETTGVQRLQIDNIDTDVAYELAYGIRGAMVSYVVNYEDSNGNQLRESDTYYGMPGDKPVVSYRYIEGYVPNAYNMGKTLSEEESKNVFTFVYAKETKPTSTTTVIRTETQGPAATGNTATGANAPGTAGNPAGTAAPGQDGDNTGVNIADNDTPLAEGPAQYVDLDENDTPLAAGSFGRNNTPLLIGSIVALLAGIFLVLMALRRRKNRNQGELEATA